MTPLQGIVVGLALSIAIVAPAVARSLWVSRKGGVR